MKKTVKHTLDNANMSEDIVFSSIMGESEQLCKDTLEEILNIKIAKIKKVQAQKFVNTIVRTKKGKKELENKENIDEFKARGIRFDVYIEGDNNIYNLEMQNIDTYNLPKRARYYMGQINSLVLKPNDDFDKLSKTYVIFICTFDLFNQDKNIYEFVYKEKKSNIPLNDGSEIIFLNTTSDRNDISENLKGFLKFIECSTKETAIKYDSPLAWQAYNQLSKLKSDKEKGDEYMNYEVNRENVLIEGEIAGKKIVARNLLNEGITIETIAKATELPIEVIERIKNNMEK